MHKKKIVKIPAFIALLMLTAFVCVARADAQEAVAPSAYRLIGTIEGKDLAGAVLIDGAGIQTFFRLHEAAPDGSQIVAVEKDHISLKRSDGTRYMLYINHDMAAGPSPSRPSAGPVIASPSTADTRPIPPDMQRFAPKQGDPGSIAATREEARARHNKPGRNASNEGAGTDQQNYTPGPNSSASGADQTQQGQHPRGHRPQPGKSASE